MAIPPKKLEIAVLLITELLLHKLKRVIPVLLCDFTVLFLMVQLSEKLREMPYLLFEIVLSTMIVLFEERR